MPKEFRLHHSNPFRPTNFTVNNFVSNNWFSFAIALKIFTFFYHFEDITTKFNTTLTWSIFATPSTNLNNHMKSIPNLIYRKWRQTTTLRYKLQSFCVIWITELLVNTFLILCMDIILVTNLSVQCHLFCNPAVFSGSFSYFYIFTLLCIQLDIT